MSYREQCIEIINGFSEKYLADVLLILKAAKKAECEAEDDAFCMKLYEEYLKDLRTEGEEFIPIEELAGLAGVEL